jgi:hypothetical protein
VKCHTVAHRAYQPILHRCTSFNRHDLILLCSGYTMVILGQNRTIRPCSRYCFAIRAPQMFSQIRLTATLYYVNLMACWG